MPARGPLPLRRGDDDAKYPAAGARGLHDRHQAARLPLGLFRRRGRERPRHVRAALRGRPGAGQPDRGDTRHRPRRLPHRPALHPPGLAGREAPRAPARRRPLRARFLGPRDAAARRGGAPHPRGARRRGDLRRLLRLVLRRAPAPRADAAPPLPRPGRRLHLVDHRLLLRHRPDPAAAHPGHDGGAARPGDRLGGHPAAREADALLRRPRGEERHRQFGRRRTARLPAADARGGGGGRAAGEHLALPRRHGGGSRRRVGADPPRLGRRDDARHGACAGRGGARGPRLSRQPLRRLGQAPRLRPRRDGRGGEDPGLGRGDHPRAPRDHPPPRAGMRRQAHHAHRRLVAPARRLRRAALLDARGAGRDAGDDRQAGARRRLSATAPPTASARRAVRCRR